MDADSAALDPAGARHNVPVPIDDQKIACGHLFEQQPVGFDEEEIITTWHAHAEMIPYRIVEGESGGNPVGGCQIDPRLADGINGFSQSRLCHYLVPPTRRAMVDWRCS